MADYAVEDLLPDGVRDLDLVVRGEVGAEQQKNVRNGVFRRVDGGSYLVKELGHEVRTVLKPLSQRLENESRGRALLGRGIGKDLQLAAKILNNVARK